MSVDDLGDTVTEDADAGTDEVQTTLDHTLGADVENLTLLDLDENVQTFDDMALGPIANGENGWNDFGPADDHEIDGIPGQPGRAESRRSGPPAIWRTILAVPQRNRRRAANHGRRRVPVRHLPHQAGERDAKNDSRLEVDIANANGTDRNTFMVIENRPATAFASP